MPLGLLKPKSSHNRLWKPIPRHFPSVQILLQVLALLPAENQAICHCRTLHKRRKYDSQDFGYQFFDVVCSSTSNGSIRIIQRPGNRRSEFVTSKCRPTIQIFTMKWCRDKNQGHQPWRPLRPAGPVVCPAAIPSANGTAITDVRYTKTPMLQLLAISKPY